MQSNINAIPFDPPYRAAPRTANPARLFSFTLKVFDVIRQRRRLAQLAEDQLAEASAAISPAGWATRVGRVHPNRRRGVNWRTVQPWAFRLHSSLAWTTPARQRDGGRTLVSRSGPRVH